MGEINIKKHGHITIISINRYNVRNAVDYKTSKMLEAAFLDFNRDDDQHIAIITGENGIFSAGADLNDAKAMSQEVLGENGPMGFTRMKIVKPVIAAISGYCVAGGLEMALTADIRIADADSMIGFLERRFGVPLIDGGTQRLPLIIGMGRALDMILTGKLVSADEAKSIGLVNYVTEHGKSLDKAMEIAKLMDSYPAVTMLNDRLALLEGLSKPLCEGLRIEAEYGKKTIDSGIVEDGAQKFIAGNGRHGKIDKL
ncbi:MAG: crotonase/enoyl-CoA hydratase family protein [Candidatus Thermoplasmatota archaeon]|nr:crotonase/enoyl-CoA hydratase family protein [Candidatus Thermoplasmatota archaeon]